MRDRPAGAYADRRPPNRTASAKAAPILPDFPAQLPLDGLLPPARPRSIAPRSVHLPPLKSARCAPAAPHSRVPVARAGVRGLEYPAPATPPQTRPSAALVFKCHFPAVLLHDSIHDRKSQPRPYSGRLSGEERIENPRRNSPRNSRAVIGYFYCNPLAVCHSRFNVHFPLPAFLQQRLLRVRQ